MSEGVPQNLEQRSPEVVAITQALQKGLIDGRYRYDRTTLFDRYHAEIDADEVVVHGPSQSTMAWEAASVSDSGHGTCRDIAPVVAIDLEDAGLVEGAEVWGLADADTKEAHYVTVGYMEEGVMVLVDAGYSTPIPMAVSVTKINATPEPVSYTMNGKNCECTATLAATADGTKEDEIHLLIVDTDKAKNDPERIIKSFNFHCIDPEAEASETEGTLDEQIVGLWTSVTDSMYKTQATPVGEPDEDGIYTEWTTEREKVDHPNQSELTAVHEAVQAGATLRLVLDGRKDLDKE